jgi:2-amino-4-hydroxy-6-hydroxymethyldihydropteridine diphosphokinase
MEILLGLGGNLGQVLEAFAGAATALAARFPVRRRSSVYLSEPLGPPQPPFYNAALLVEITVHPLELLAYCQALEEAFGRGREQEGRWGPRSLDLDLLLAPGLVLRHPQLELPHPRLHQRRFALLPAAEIAPGLRHPRLQRTLEELAALVPEEGQRCSRLGPFPG